jgi:hypothetical protein
VFHWLNSAVRLNGTPGILARLKSGSLERAIVRLDAGIKERAVKCANCNRSMMR